MLALGRCAWAGLTAVEVAASAAVPVGWDDFFAAAPRTPDDFLAEREQESPQERDWADALDA